MDKTVTPPAAMLEFCLDEEASWQFARLSGDFNPLHVDAVAARRLQFGGTVCHGVHLVLKSLDLAIAAGRLMPAKIEQIEAVFGAAVRTGSRVTVQLTAEPGTQRAKLMAHCNGRQAFTVKLVLADPASSDGLWIGALPGQGEPHVPAPPTNVEFPAPESLASLASTVPLDVNTDLLSQLLPAAAASPAGPQLAADLMATTRIVGMECPGLHSIYSEFKLRRRAPASDTPAGRMGYTVQRADPRFRSVRLAVTGETLAGTLTAIFRAPPVAQVSLRELQAQIPPGRFAGQEALVVGGSRGLGELVVKILQAGGARVSFSYAQGQADAERIQQEAASLGQQIETLQIDARQDLTPKTLEHLTSRRWTHLYYFATQQITKSAGAGWDAALFDNFCRLYVHGFAELVAAAGSQCTPDQRLSVLYPSTVFLDEPESGFSEYRAAKAAGESLCESLATNPGLLLSKPRLPRLQTDQNSSFLGVEGDKPLPVMLALLESMHPLERSDPAE